jgi:hypothetical protein
MDGERDVAGLVQWAKEELGIEPSPAELEQVISTLGGLGYLEAAQAAASVAQEREATTEDEYGLRAGVHHAAARPDAMPASGEVELGHGNFGRPSADEAMPASGGDFELGVAGGTSSPMAGGPAIDDLELGAPGMSSPPVEPMPTLRRGKTRPDIDDDGPTNLPPADAGSFDDDEVSVDLSQHLGDLGRDDVKEAVRMSRSMQAVQVPPELLEQLGEQEAAIASRAQQAKDEAAERRRNDEPPPAPVIDEVKPEVRGVRDVKPPEPVKPVTKPDPRAKEPSKPAADPHAKPVPVAEPGGGVSTILVVFLVLALLGGGAFFVWKYVLNKKSTDDDAAEVSTGSGKTKKPKPGSDVGTASGTQQASGTDVGTGTGTASGTDVGTGTGTAVAGPPAPTATLVEVPGTPLDINSGAGGTVAWVVNDGTKLQIGDPVVQYKGAEYFKVELGNSKEGLIKEIEVSVPARSTRLPRPATRPPRREHRRGEEAGQVHRRSHQAPRTEEGEGGQAPGEDRRLHDQDRRRRRGPPEVRARQAGRQERRRRSARRRRRADREVHPRRRANRPAGRRLDPDRAEGPAREVGDLHDHPRSRARTSPRPAARTRPRRRRRGPDRSLVEQGDLRDRERRAGHADAHDVALDLALDARASAVLEGPERAAQLVPIAVGRLERPVAALEIAAPHGAFELHG